MDFPYLSKVAKLALALAYELSNAPRPPGRVFARGTQELGTTVTLRGGETPIYQTGWEIVWRNSTAADWQDSVFVPVGDNGGFSLVLKQVLLDDSIVGVRSVSVDGCRSRASVVPEPGTRRRRRR